MRTLAAVTLLISASPAVATLAVPVSVEELARTSDAVVRAKVTGLEARRSDDGMRIYTVVALKRSAVLRGKAPAKLSVSIPGGVIGNEGQRVDGAPRFEKGEDVVVFLRSTGAGSYAVNALAQGKFKVVGAIARPDVSQMSFTQTSVRPGERRVEEMPLAELERRVRSTR